MAGFQSTVHPCGSNRICAPTCARQSLEEGNDEKLKLPLESRGDNTRALSKYSADDQGRSPSGLSSVLRAPRPLTRPPSSVAVHRDLRQFLESDLGRIPCMSAPTLSECTAPPPGSTILTRFSIEQVRIPVRFGEPSSFQRLFLNPRSRSDGTTESSPSTATYTRSCRAKGVPRSPEWPRTNPIPGRSSHFRGPLIGLRAPARGQHDPENVDLETANPFGRAILTLSRAMTQISEAPRRQATS